jgi:UDP-N-acetylglucosamine--N-acetylmuramyl-(pentapeptide) pyrophosphoryl-undecaprenol N-acetylglucosamine transferase
MGFDGKTILIAAGGTGGHVFPGLALASEIKRKYPRANVVFAGTRRGFEEKIIPAHGYRLLMVDQIAIKGMGKLNKALAVARLPMSFLEAMSIISRVRPDLFIGIGGYAAGPLAIAAYVMRVPAAAVEPNAIPGFTNRMLGKFTRKTFVAFEGAKKYFRPSKVVLTGAPIRREILDTKAEPRISGDRKCVLVIGGSQGARRLNSAMVEAAPLISDLKGRISFIHQTGRVDDINAIRAAYSSNGLDADVREFIDEIWKAYAVSDFVISRSGAGAVAEFRALSLPAMLVPYPFAADDHQRANAMSLVDAGGAVMVDDGDMNGAMVAGFLRSIVMSPKKLADMHDALERNRVNDAAGAIIEECERLLDEDQGR